MKDCLKEEQLVELLIDEAPPHAQKHVRNCLACSRRYRKLVEDMQLLDLILRSDPPPITAHHTPRYRLVALAVPVFATLVVAFFGGLWVGRDLAARSGRVAAMAASSDLGRVSENIDNPTIVASIETPRGVGKDVSEDPVAASYVTFLEDNFATDETCASSDNSFDPACVSVRFAEGNR